MKSLLSILSALLDDASSSLGADTKRDRETILDRCEHEGVAFLHITLADFGSWLEQSLEAGGALATVHSTFRKRPKGARSVLPCFLHGLTRLVFDEHTGLLRSDANPTAVFFIRQICYLFKKPKALASAKRIAKAIEQYRQTDLDVFTYRDIKTRFKTSDVARSPFWDERVHRTWLNNHDYWSFEWIAEVCKHLLPPLEARYLEARTLALPKHGPGATADKLGGNSKFTTRDWYERWNGIFFHEDLYGYTVEMEEDLKVVRSRDELPVKVIPVPKTYKTSRIISVEPTAMQYAQQLVLAKMVYAIEKTELGNVIKLTDQSQNRRLALKGSLPTRFFSTIDLSEASDRVGCALVHFLLKSHCPTLCRELFAVRSSHATLPDSDEKLPIRKYASMGSATTFPVESVIFAILSIAGVARSIRDYESGSGDGFKSHSRWTRSNCVRKATTLVSVFGDDIIVPKTAFNEVCYNLEALGLKVNMKKSFAQGPFKESCGGDYYNGVDVTPAYCRTMAPSGPADAESLVSFVSLSNQLYKKGCWRAADEVKSSVEKILGKLPLKRETSGFLGWETFVNAAQYGGFDKNFSPWVTSYALKTRKVRDNLDGYSALLKHFLSKMPQETSDHLSYSAQRHSMRLRRGRLPA